MDADPPKLWVHALAQVDIYMDDFISTCQGSPSERRPVLRHLFQIIDIFFRPNVDTYGLHKDTISTKKLGQGGST